MMQTGIALHRLAHLGSDGLHMSDLDITTFDRGFLIHVFSERFNCRVKETSKGNNINSLLPTQEWMQEESLFRVIPGFRKPS